MIDHEPTSILLLGSEGPLAGTSGAWLHTHFAEPLTIHSVHTVPDALAYLRDHHVDLVLVDEAAARTELRTIHTVSPATAVIALAMGTDTSALLHTLRQGVHEVLSLHPSAETDHVRTIERALARVNGRTDILKESDTRAYELTISPRLIHDLNNLLTSINGFADLLLSRLAPDDPARMNAEQIRLAGKRAVMLLKAHAPAVPASPPLSSPATPPITARAA
jgi:signal transduction histidine kinase